MAKRLRDVCGLPESQKLWQSGRGFIVRNLPTTQDQLRKLPHFEFENWAVIAVGGVPNEAQVGDMGIDGRIYPTSGLPRESKEAQLPFMDTWYLIQVKQVDKAGRPDIDKFEAVLMRENRDRGYFVAFDYSSDAHQEINSFFKRTGREIIPFTVKQFVEEDFTSQRRPPISETGRMEQRRRIRKHSR
jgi:hypothetical protein